MGDLFGSESTTTSTSEPFSGITKDRFNNFYNTLLNNYNNRTGYTGQFTAPMNSAQNQAISLLGNYTNNQALSDFASGKYLDPETNPYTQKYADQLKTNANNQFKDTANAIDTRFNNRGFYDSSSHASTLDRAADTANENYDNALTNLYSNTYQQGVSNMLNANSTQQSAANSLLNAGNTAYNISDTELQRKYQDYLASQGFSQQDISNMLNYFNVGKNPTETKTTEESGLGGIMGSLAGGWASGWGKATSDARIKSAVKVIENALATVNRLKPCTYFKHDYSVGDGLVVEETGRESSGFIAQELVQVIPTAVDIPMDADRQVYRVRENELIPYLCKAIQELSKKVDELSGEAG